ncbi:hypothetical protein C2S52_023209 [Perilla frutescens var. hirtella]|nr:hypothetical protein C2S52_023209 [Perilla frutescens var. hirtella]
MMLRSLRSSACKSVCSSILRRHSTAAASDALQSQSQSPFESRLRTILRNEIQYQHDYAPPHQPVTEFDRFVVEDRPGQQWITLRSESAEGENIKIEATMFDGSILANQGSECDDEEQQEAVHLHISMLVDIWRKGEETDYDPMEFVCSAWPHSLEIQKVYTLNRLRSPTQPYMGPDIKNVNSKLRTGFYEFLDARGINGDLSRFLHQYMMNKDRIELIQWLGKVQSYFEK